MLALMSSAKAFKSSISTFCCGQPILRPSCGLGLGIWQELAGDNSPWVRRLTMWK